MAGVTRDGNGWVLHLQAGASGNELLEGDWIMTAGEIFELFCVKQKGYSTKNINRLGQAGIVTRLREKLDRLDNLMEIAPQALYTALAGTTLQESIDDTWKDIADYGVIGLLKYRGDWPADPTNAVPSCPSCGKAI